MLELASKKTHSIQDKKKLINEKANPTCLQSKLFIGRQNTTKDPIKGVNNRKNKRLLIKSNIYYLNFKKKKVCLIKKIIKAFLFSKD